MKDPDFGHSYISIMRRTEDTDNLYEMVIDALSWVPEKLIGFLVEAGVRIVLTPTIEEAFEKTGDSALARNGANTTGEYSSTSKTIYIAEGPFDSYGVYTYADVNNGIGYAYVDLMDPEKRIHLAEILEDDYKNLPKDLERHFGNAEPQETFATVLGSLLTLRDTEVHQSKLFHDLKRALPKTVEFTTDVLIKFDWKGPRK